jgi:alpha-galactosidase
VHFGTPLTGPDVDVVADVSEAGTGMRLDWSVRNPGRRPVTLDRVGVSVAGARFQQVLEHGWQSWSVVRRCGAGDVRPERRQLPAWRRALAFADGRRAGTALVGEPFLVSDAGVIGFLEGSAHLSTVEVTAAGEVTAWALLDGVSLPPGEERRLDPVWLAGGDPGTLYSEYAARLSESAGGGRIGTPAPCGWCSWYQYYASVTPSDVRANLRAAAGAGLEVVQIDDGYQAAIGEWLTPRASWAEGTEALAAAVREAGLRPGLWTAPFLADEHGLLSRDHPGWFLRGRAGRPVRAMHNPVWWGGWALALDTTHPGVLDHLTATFAALAGQGFDYHKVDFLYAAALPGRRHDPGVTRAQALRAGLEAVRAGIGDDAFLLGCGSPFGPAVGLVDAMRVSPDVAPWWAPRRVRPGVEEASSCARNAVVTSLLRAPLHRRLWINDNDCLLLRPSGTRLEPWQRRVLAATVAGGGGFTLVSDDLSLYGPGEWALLASVLAAAPDGDAPLELVDPFAPVLTVRSRAYELTVAADASSARLTRRSDSSPVL